MSIESDDTNTNLHSVYRLVIALDGVGGTGLLPLSLLAAARLARSNLRVQRFFWNHGVMMPFKDLLDKEHMTQKTSELADLISGIDPQISIQIVAKSGGSLVAIKALELLPVNRVKRVVLLSPAVSPNYDLSPALQSISSSLICHHSHLDRLILGLGTSIFGTSDGARVVSAGCTGFTNVPRVCRFPEQYSKLEQPSWRPEMLKQLHNGLHFGNTSTPWLLRHVIPRLME